MLQNTGKLEEVVLPSNIKSIPISFLSGSLIEKLDIPSGVLVIEEHAFYGCKELKSISIPDTVKVIEAGAFTECEKLLDVKFSSGLKYIYDLAFAKTAIKEVKLSDGLLGINMYAFSECDELTSVTLPKSLEKIERFVFYGCEKLFEISYEGTMADWAKVNVDVEAFSNSSVTKIVCSDGVIEL